jgi:4-amino-4-deoxy-L-arabinose transferase-like glycosyltransferase
MRSRWRWALVVTSATGLDLLMRFAGPFDFRRVMHMEAVLFPATAGALALLFRGEPSSPPWPRRARIGLVALFGLGGLRPVLWTLGLPLSTANLSTLAAALASTMIWVLRRRRRPPGSPPIRSSDGSV